MPPDPDRRAANERLLRERLNAELLAGRDFVEGRLARLFPGLLGRLVNPLAKGLYHAIGEEEVRRRANRQLDLLFAAAREASERGLDAAVGAWADRILETEEVVHRGNRSHPRFPEVRARLLAMLSERLALVLGFLERGEGATFDDAVRAAYPDRGVLDRELARQFGLGREIVRLVESNPDLLRFPRALQHHLFPLVHEVIGWYEARLRDQLALVYGGTGSASPSREL